MRGYLRRLPRLGFIRWDGHALSGNASPISHDLRNEIVEELIPIEERKSFRTGR
jgi:hypothetical protein